MSIRLYNSSGGYIDMNAGGTASAANTFTLPAETGTILTSASSLDATSLTGNVAAARIVSALNAEGSAPIYACRAWVNFNGTGTVAIRGSGNVSSITDNGTGNYTVNFTTAMPDVNYSVSGMASDVGGTGNRGLVSLYKGVTTPAVGSFRIFTFADTTQTDNEYIYCSVFR